MGVVYLAEDDTGTRVAVKLIRDELAQDPSFRARFARKCELGSASEECAPPATSLLTLIPSTPTSSPNTSRAGTSSISYSPWSIRRRATGRARRRFGRRAGGNGGGRGNTSGSQTLQRPHGRPWPQGGRLRDLPCRRRHVADANRCGGRVTVVDGARTGSRARVWSGRRYFLLGSDGRRLPFGEGRPEAVVYRVVHEEPDLDGIDPRLARTSRLPSPKSRQLGRTQTTSSSAPSRRPWPVNLYLPPHWTERPRCSNAPGRSHRRSTPSLGRGRQIAMALAASRDHRRLHCWRLVRSSWRRQFTGASRGIVGHKYELDNKDNRTGRHNDDGGAESLADGRGDPARRRVSYLLRGGTCTRSQNPSQHDKCLCTEGPGESVECDRGRGRAYGRVTPTGWDCTASLERTARAASPCSQLERYSPTPPMPCLPARPPRPSWPRRTAAARAVPITRPVRTLPRRRDFRVALHEHAALDRVDRASSHPPL